MSEYDLLLAFQWFKCILSNACIELLTCTQRTCSGTAARWRVPTYWFERLMLLCVWLICMTAWLPLHTKSIVYLGTIAHTYWYSLIGHTLQHVLEWVIWWARHRKHWYVDDDRYDVWLLQYIDMWGSDICVLGHSSISSCVFVHLHLYRWHWVALRLIGNELWTVLRFFSLIQG